MIGWLLNLVYAGLLLVSSPWLLYRAVVQGKNRTGWSEKLWGGGPVRTSICPAVWFHAVSVGEVLLLRTLLPAFRSAHPGCEIWISTTTHTGRAVAEEKYPDCTVIYFPLDFTWAVRRALARVRPALIVLVELELWPNFIRIATDQQIPVALVNGRMSERSFRGYRRIRGLIGPLLRRLAVLAVQTPEYGQRLVALGAAPEQVIVTGSTKFDGLETRRDNPRTTEIRQSWGLAPDALIFMAGSTQAPEEQYALDAYTVLRPSFPALRLILVPRHQERFEEVAELVRSRGLPLLRRSAVKGGPALPLDSGGEPPVMLMDTLGELSAGWGLARIAFVGGSLTPRGGQNMIEPAAYAAAVLFGPNTSNFQQVVELLLGASAALVVQSPDELTATVRRLLERPAEADHLGQLAQNLVLPQQGATARTIEILSRVMPGQ